MNKNINIDLFQKINFISHAGLPLTWKIECDAISPDEWVALAHIIREYEPRNWRAAVGIPRGGVALGKALDKYSTQNIDDPVLVVDDVYTTGKSFQDYVAENYPNEEVLQWCVFARKPPQRAIDDDYGVNALFTMPYKK
jgi:hypoxanthine phosphoribosyltransferase